MTVIQPRQTKRYGWLPDLPDNRDHLFTKRFTNAKLPSKVDLRIGGFMPEVYDQGNLGSCTANAIAGAYEYEQRRQGLTDFNPSRLFIYYEERRKINTLQEDSGAFIRDGLQVVNKLGAPHESLWPYDINRFTVAPEGNVYTDGLNHQATGYASIAYYTQVGVKTSLAMGIPVIFGFTVYPWFENPDVHGVVRPVGNQPVWGGHAVLLVGYEHMAGSRNVWGIVRNSWGSGWADQGYCYIPLNWVCGRQYNADDFWVINQVEA